mmetsp:Transcript_13688/g.19944  ORF Transcript_13688/g.19944 Transcript_13688/m.19944 type:complete len:259 (-) Transcript_13688:125-901(-)
MKGVPFENDLSGGGLCGVHSLKAQSMKKQTFEADSKSFSRSTASMSSLSDDTNSDTNHHLMTTDEERYNSSNTKLFLVYDLMHSNRLLERENLEMKAKMKDMEESQQRRQLPEKKEQELTAVIDMMSKLIKHHEKKMHGIKKTQDKQKIQISENHDMIERLQKENDELRTICLENEEERLALYEEISCLQQELTHNINHAKECNSQLEHQNLTNDILTERIETLEAELPSLTLDDDAPTVRMGHIFQPTRKKITRGYS